MKLFGTNLYIVCVLTMKLFNIGCLVIAGSCVILNHKIILLLLCHVGGKF